ncbi:MAG TPA: ABC transporter ATP-binding protein [Burkholderiales bacterium]|nr:ABC transporter ATP-binding protein [Burkholderiales bacterium]
MTPNCAASAERPARLVDVRDLVVFIGDRPVLDGVRLRLEAGEIYGLLGPNGAGKSTTIAALTGLRRPVCGKVSVLGLDPWTRRVALHAAIGVLPEQSGFYEWMSAPEYLRWFARLYGRRLDDTALRAQLERVGLDAANRKAIGTYSRGWKQRLGLARALLNEPRLVILDEPTNGLDPRGRREIHDVLLGLARDRGAGVLLCTHLLDDVERLCSRIGVIHEGRTRFEGPVGERLEERYLELTAARAAA